MMQFGRMTQCEVPRHEARRSLDLMLAIEGVEQGGADFVRRQEDRPRNRRLHQAAAPAAHSNSE